MNQHTLILDFIRKYGTLTPYQAFECLGITKLATRISELRAKGAKIKDVWEENHNRYGKKVRYKKYYI